MAKSATARKPKRSPHRAANLTAKEALPEWKEVEEEVLEDQGPEIKFEYTRPPMYAKQLAAIFCAERYGLIEASTKAGKTVGCIAWLFEQAFLGKDGQTFWWVAPVYNQAKIAFNRMVRAIPVELIKHVHNGDLNIWLINGALMQFKSGEKPDGLYGEDVYAAVVDEASRMREESWHAIRSTLTATRGPVRLIGNVRGRKNFFYALARKAEAGTKEMHYAKITAYDAVAGGVLDAAEIEDAKALLPEHVFRELYLAEPSDDGGNPFGLGAIRNCVKPLSNHPPASWGWDLAKSTDWTVGTALDRFGQVCRFIRFQMNWEATYERILKETGNVPALVDSTGVGDPIVERLQKARPGVFEGYTFSQQSKQKLMEGLAFSIQKGEVSVIEGTMQSEMEEFEYVYTRTGVLYSAPEGFHDDCVCSLALANIHLQRAAPAVVVTPKVVQKARAHRFTLRTGRLG